MILEQFHESICKKLAIGSDQMKGFPSSYVQVSEDQLMMCELKGIKKILASGTGNLFSQLEGMALTETLKLCPLSHENRLVLNRYLPFTRPTAFGKQTATFGLGDRLGVATPGHIRCFRNRAVKPILAQQSKRELQLTERTYKQVLDDVCFAVFQNGYRDGFGADGDHLKNPEDIQDALDCGYTMVTLDCSDKIGKGIESLPAETALRFYHHLSPDYRTRIENSYLSKGFLIAGKDYFFSKEELIRCVLIYHQAIDFAAEVYSRYIRQASHEVDFELSIDETESVTTAQGHLFVAMELKFLQVDITSLAPRFVGEFQKGIEYSGNLDQFEKHLNAHAAIADHFGYKLSIHSGSDKFSVYPFIGQYSGGRYHVKTSGTSWLEAIALIADKNPALYHRIHKKALTSFEEAKKFYRVSCNPDALDSLENMQSREADYLKDDNSRQLLHITFGFILNDEEIRRDLYHTLKQNEENYYERLLIHIGRHLDLLHLTVE